MDELFSEFSPVSKKEWLSNVEHELMGRPIEELNWTFENAEFTPFYHPDEFGIETQPLYSFDSEKTREVGEIIIISDKIEVANEIALEALNGGCNALLFALSSPIDRKDLHRLLDKINLEWVSTHFRFKSSPNNSFIPDLQSFINMNNIDIKKCKGSFEDHDYRGNLERVYKNMSQLPGYKFITFVKNNKQYPHLTSPISQELADILLEMNSLLSRASSFNEIEKMVKSIKVKTTLTDDYFANISKLRSLRLLMNNLLSAWKLPLPIIPIEVSIQPTPFESDANNAIIKANLQIMAAIIGGANGIFTCPFDHFTNSKGSQFSRRITRNINHLLMLESHMGRVNDPSAGSYHLEKLTEHICESSWKLFQTMSRHG